MKRWLILCLVAVTVLWQGACSKKSGATVGGDVFASAAPELKASWDTAAAALATNDYATAFLTLRQLVRQPGLSPAQTEAIQVQSAVVYGRMNQAAQKGDPGARQALDDIRQASRSRPLGQ
jgi:hypothetical protein